MAAQSPYSTALLLGRAAPVSVNSKQIQDVERLTAYFTYSDIYNNVPDIWDALMRPEQDSLSKRMPDLARGIVEATLRYLGKGLHWTATDVNGDLLADDARVSALMPIDALFTREEFAAKFISIKRDALIKGDALLHVTADPNKPEGSRIRITELDPATYFPKFDATDSERVVGAYIVEPVLADDGTTVVSLRIGYDRVMNDEDAAATGLPVGSIRADMDFFEVAGWDDRYPLTQADLKPTTWPTRYNTPANQLLAQGVALPSQITAIPVYHIRNNRRGTEPFGVSELQGIETLLAGLAQGLSDEDLTIALQGVGFYATDSGHPTDSQGNEVDWVVAPGSVAELEKGGKFWRVEGATNVDSMQHHMAALGENAQQTTGTPEVALGRVDVAVADSGIALAIQFAPITAKNQEKETELKAKLDQFMFDLVNGWMPAYEGYNGGGITVKSGFDDPLPVNRKETVEEIVALKQAGLISVEFALQLLQQRLGYNIPNDMLAQIAAEQAALLDAVGGRVASEAGAP